MQRIHPSENVNAVAVAQVAASSAASRPAGWCRSSSSTWATIRHGHKLDCGDPATWPDASAEVIVEDAQYGRVRVRAWGGLHPKTRAHDGRDSCGPRPIVRGTLVLVEVRRLPGEPYPPQVLWLWWHGPADTVSNLDLLWRAYVHRFDRGHIFRFPKQTLGWHTLRIRHPEQADRWTWLVLAAYTQLRLARALVADRRLIHFAVHQPTTRRFSGPVQLFFLG